MDTSSPTVDVTHEHGRSDTTGSGPRAEHTVSYTRSPQDVLRLIVFAVSALAMVAAAIWLDDAVAALEEDIVNLFGFLSSSIERILVGLLTIVQVLVVVVVYLIPLRTKRYRLFGYIVAASVLTFVVMSGVQWLVDRETSTTVINELAARAGVSGDGAAGPIALAQTTAMFVVVGPFVSHRWRRAGVVTISVLFLVQILVAPKFPVDAVASLPLGAMCASAVLLAFGRPDRRPTLSAIAAALGGAGLPTMAVRAAKVDARGSTPYFATLTGGTELFVKVLGSQERAADLMFRVYRFLRFKNVGDDRPFSSLRRTIEHEALVALLARDVGVRTPRLRGVVDVGSDSMLLVYEMIDGGSLDGVADGDVSDELMRGIWEQVAILRDHRIAHRDLRRANVFVGDDRVPWMIDFGFSEVAVADSLLDADVAQLLASLAVPAGAQRTVAAAIDVLGTDAIGSSLPRLQNKALSGATQTALKDHPGLLEELQSEVRRRCQIDDVQFVALERTNRKTVILVGALALATYFLIPQLADLPGIFGEIEGANWAWTPVILLFAAGTYLAAAMSMSGAVPQHLPAGPLVTATVGSSFASKLAPAAVGGMALNIRFLQKQGVDQPVAVSAVGLNTISGFVGHITLVGVFLVWAGREAFGSFELPDPTAFLIGIAVVVVIGMIAVALPWTRQLIRARFLPIVGRAFDGVSEVVRQPGKVALLIGGSTLVTFCYLTTLYFSVEAFGGGLEFAVVGAVFLVGSAIAQAAPTPGGLGAVEAALIAGLVAAGLDNTIAVPAVFLYRLFTFWLPILPGWLAFHWLERHDYI